MKRLLLFSVYGSPALQFIERSWNKSKAEKTTTGKFDLIKHHNFLSL